MAKKKPKKKPDPAPPPDSLRIVESKIADQTGDVHIGLAEFKEPGAADPPPLAGEHVKLGISDGPDGTRVYKDGELVHEGPPGGLNAALALTGELLGRDEPGPVKPSEEAEAVLAFLTTEAAAYFKTVGLVENVATEHIHRFVGWLQSSLPRRFPGLTQPVYGIDWPADKMKLAAAGTFENAAEEPLAFGGGSNILLEFNGDSWTAMCNAASGAGYVRQTRAEGADLKTPQAALAAVLKVVRERAGGAK